MNNEIIKDSMFVKAEVAADEKEHIAAPASSMIADAWRDCEKQSGSSIFIYSDRHYLTGDSGTNFF